jgi:hypothetical protein
VSLTDELRVVLPGLRRVVDGLEGALDVVEELTDVAYARDPVPHRMVETLSHPHRLLPVQDLSSPAHIRAGDFAVRLLSVVDRRTVLVWDTAPNRALLHGLRAAVRRLAAAGTPAAQRLRVHYASLTAAPGLKEAGAMRPTDLLHRSLRAARYRPVLTLHRLLRQ